MSISRTQLETDRKAAWRYRHAQYCFDQVIWTQRELDKLGWTEDHPLVFQLSVANVLLYARPFSNNAGIGALNEDFVPENLRVPHRKLVLLRNKVYAHHDTINMTAAEIQQTVPQIRLVCTKGKQEMIITDFPFKFEAFSQVSTMAVELRDKCEWHIEKLLKKYHREFVDKLGIHDLKLGSPSDTLFDWQPNS